MSNGFVIALNYFNLLADGNLLRAYFAQGRAEAPALAREEPAC